MFWFLVFVALLVGFALFSRPVSYRGTEKPTPPSNRKTDKRTKKDKEIYLVIGGCGFLGKYIVDELLNRNETVYIFDLRKTFDNDKIKFFTGDIRKLEDLVPACTGVTTVIHTASPHANASAELLYQVNVIGTQRVIEACKKCGVSKLVYTSSASVVFDGTDLLNVDESLPYLSFHSDEYMRTKELGEKEVIKASVDMYTCSIRPSGLFGPGDVQAWPPMIEAGKQGKTKWIIGETTTKFEWTYIENVALSHVLAADKLDEKPEQVNGEVFFISNGEPENIWKMVEFIAENFGFPKPSLRIPSYVAYPLGYFVDLLAAALKPVVVFKPTFSYLRVMNLTANKVFNLEKARKVLDYKPRVSLQEGKNRTLKYFREQMAKQKTQ